MNKIVSYLRKKMVIKMNFIQENWELIKQTVKKEYDLTDISFNTWIMPLKLHNVEDDVVNIIIPSDQ